MQTMRTLGRNMAWMICKLNVSEDGHPDSYLNAIHYHLCCGDSWSVMTVAMGYIAKYYLRKGSKELKGAKGRRVKLKAKMKALSLVPRLLVEIPEQIGSSGLSWAMKGFEKAYSKVTNIIR